MKSLSIIIPDYFSLDKTIKVSEELASCPSVKCVVIVNDAPGQKKYKSHMDNIYILHHSHNRGYAAALNSAYKYLLSKNLTNCLVLNSDVKLSRENIEYISALSISNQAIVGFIDSSENTTIVHKCPSNISGFCFLINLTIFSEVNFWDESFFMYGEELEFFSRVHNSGFNVKQVPLILSHVSMQSSLRSKNIDWRSWLSIRNSFYLAKINNQYFRLFILPFYFSLVSLNWINKQDASSARIHSISLLTVVYYSLLSYLWLIFISTKQNFLAMRLNAFTIKFCSQ